MRDNWHTDWKQLQYYTSSVVAFDTLLASLVPIRDRVVRPAEELGRTRTTGTPKKTLTYEKMGFSASGKANTLR
jgi:hypothetical protein